MNDLEGEIDILINEIFVELDNTDELENHDIWVEEFFDYCIKDGKLEIMLVLSALLPKIINSGSYVESLTNLMKKLTYKECKPKKSFTSTREHLWSYKFSPYETPDLKFKIPKPAGLDKFEEIEKHTAILCYAPLPGLSTRLSKDNVLNYIFPYKQSSFVKLTVSNPLDYSLKSKSLLVVYSSPPIQAIIKFKWHAFARYCWIIFVIFYLLTLVLLSVAVYCKDYNTTNNDTLNKMWITNMIFGAILALVVLRCVIALIIMKFKESEHNTRYLLSPISYFVIITFILPLIVSFLEYKQYLDSVNIIKVKACLHAFTFLMSWICLIALLIAVKNIGIFIIVFIEICHRIAWFLIFLFLVLLACAHAAMTYLTLVPNEDTASTNTSASTENNAASHFDTFGKSLKSFWSMMLSDYDPVKDERTSAFMIKFIFSLPVNILLLNVLIAIVNKAYEQVLYDSYTKWTIFRAYIISLMEIIFVLPRQNKEFFPCTITYEANIEKLKEEKNLKLEEDCEKYIGKTQEQTQASEQGQIPKLKIKELGEKIKKLLQEMGQEKEKREDECGVNV